jgi:hypothetical protein
VCVLGMTCVINIAGVNLTVADRLIVVTDSTCGGSFPNLVNFTDLLEDQPVGHQVAGALPTMMSYHLGSSSSDDAAIGGRPQTDQICWASAPTLQYDMTLNKTPLGTLTMQGLYQGLVTECQLCQYCSVTAYGMGLASTDRILLIEGGGSCGDAAQMQAAALYSSTGGLQNPPSLGIVSAISIVYNVGIAAVGVPGDYTICWARNPSGFADYAVTLCVFTLKAREPTTFAGAAYGACTELSSGVAFATSDGIGFRSGVLSPAYEATRAADNDTSTSWLSETGTCASQAGSCASGICGSQDFTSCAWGCCEGAAPQVLVFDLLSERAICKLQIVNGFSSGSDTSYGARSLAVETGTSSSWPWAVAQVFSPLAPVCPGQPIEQDLLLSQPAVGPFVRLRVIDGWGADAAGLAKVLFWLSPWDQHQPIVDLTGPIPSPGLPGWAVWWPSRRSSRSSRRR